MNVAVLVPRRPEPWRDGLWAYVRATLEAADLPVFEGLDEGPGPMNRSAALNRAAAEAGDWEVAVILDADTLIDLDRLREGVELAAETGHLVLPHSAFRSLARVATREVVRSGLPPATAPARWISEKTKSSCLCVPRKLWDEVGGFDEAFIGWGFEDATFYAACRRLAGVERLEGEVIHLWHPRSPEKDPRLPEYVANRKRALRYKRVRDADGMRRLLEELRR